MRALWTYVWTCSRLSVNSWKSEGDIWEAVQSFHHVNWNWTQVLEFGSRSLYWLSFASCLHYGSFGGSFPTHFSPVLLWLQLSLTWWLLTLVLPPDVFIHQLTFLLVLHIRNYFKTFDFLHHKNHCYDLILWQVLCEYWGLLNLLSLWKKCFPPSHTCHN